MARPPADVSARIVELALAEFGGVQAKLAEAVHAEFGSARNWDSTQTAVGRAVKAGRSGRPLTDQQTEELLGVLGFDGDDALAAFVATHCKPDTGQTLGRLRHVLRDQEAEALAVRDAAGEAFALNNVVGSVIELRRFQDVQGERRHWGIPIGNVTLENTGFRFSVAEELRFASIQPDPPNWPKFTLHCVEPPDTHDANAGHVRLRLWETNYDTVRQCDPSIYHDPAGGVFEADGRRVDNDVRAVNRRTYGSPDPQRTQVPYCLTMFVAIVLDDGHVLFMRRSNSVGWFRNTFEFSGGEQLKDVDVGLANPVEMWLRRAVWEEFLPVSELDHDKRVAAEQKLFGAGYLSAIGYDTVTCSFPVFALYRAKLTRQGYLDLWRDIRHEHPGSLPDREGAIGILNQTELRRLLTDGQMSGRVLRVTSDDAAFVLSLDDQTAGQIRLRPDNLHPMSAYRLALLADVLKL